MTTRQKKKTRTMLAVLGAIVVLGGAYVAVTQISKHQQAKEDEKNESASLAEAERLKIFSFDSSEIVQISYTNPQETLTFVYDETAGEWQYEGDREYPLIQTAVSGIASTVSQLNAAGIIDETLDNLEEYGLDDPQYTIVLTKEDGEEIRLYFGIENTFSSQYYMYVEGNENVYLMGESLVTYASRTLSDMLNVAAISVPSSTELTQAVLELGESMEQEWSLEYIADGGKEYAYYAYLTWFYELADGTKAAADSDVIESLTSAIGSLSITNCAIYQATEEELAECGLASDAPATAVLTLRYAEETDSTDEEAETETKELKLIIGKLVSDTADEQAENEEEEETTLAADDEAEGESGVLDLDDLELENPEEEGAEETRRYYVREAGSDIVYYADADTLDAIIGLQQRELYNKNPILISITDLDGFDVTFGEGERIEYEIARTTETDEDGNETTVTSYTMNGTSLDAAYVTAIYYELISTLAADRVLREDETPAEYAPELEVVYHTNLENYPEITIGFTEYDNNYYQVTVMGETKLLVNKRSVETMCSNFSEALDVLERLRENAEEE